VGGKAGAIGPGECPFPLDHSGVLGRATLDGGKLSAPSQEHERAWQSTMGAAFHSPQFDDYLDRVAQLNRRVVPRYGFYDPYEVQSRVQVDLRISLLIIASDTPNRFFCEEQGLKREVIRRAGRTSTGRWRALGQLIDSSGRTARENTLGTTLQAMAYRQLQASSERAGNQAEAALFGYPWRNSIRPGERTLGQRGSRRLGAILPNGMPRGGDFRAHDSPVFRARVIALSILIAGSRRKAGPAAKRAKPVATICSFTKRGGFVVLLCLPLYLTIGPTGTSFTPPF